MAERFRMIKPDLAAKLNEAGKFTSESFQIESNLMLHVLVIIFDQKIATFETMFPQYSHLHIINAQGTICFSLKLAAPRDSNGIDFSFKLPGTYRMQLESLGDADFEVFCKLNSEKDYHADMQHDDDDYRE